MRLPEWWPRQVAHAAGGLAIGLVSTLVFGLPEYAPIVGVTVVIWLKEAIADAGARPFYKHAVDIVAWVGGTFAGTMIGG